MRSKLLCSTFLQGLEGFFEICVKTAPVALFGVARFTECFSRFSKMALVIFNRAPAQQVQPLLLRGDGKDLPRGYKGKKVTLQEGQSDLH